MPFESLTIDLEHCYGIKKLAYNWQSDDNGTLAIYAPNGTMKSSFARTLQAVADGLEPTDEMYPDRETSCSILDQNGNPLDSAHILVVPPYSESFQSQDKVSTLLVNPKLRDSYQKIQQGLDAKMQAFLKAMHSTIGRRSGADREISMAFMGKPDALLDALRRVRPEIDDMEDAPWADVPYGTLFDPRVADLVKDSDVQEVLADYVDRLNDLLDRSPYFSRDTFSYWSANQVARALAKHGFFDATHRVQLTSSDGETEDVLISSEAELVTILGDEKQRITEDSELKTRFDKLAKKLERNDKVRAFKECLDAHPGLIPLLSNYEGLRQDVWKSYFFTNKNEFDALTDEYEAARTERAEIQEQAKKETTRWHEVIEVFNGRFSVPFRLRATNQVDLVVGAKDAMELAFDFQEDGEEPVPVERETLLASLSQGERRAMYLLDVLFEVEARRKDKVPTLFVFDDVADSFDYKNKYAIVRYLEDLKGAADMRSVILTHNFDFLRSIHGSVVARSHCKIAVRYSDRIELEGVPGIKNIFTNDWKPRFFDNGLKRIASIPFLRNMVEYLHGETHADYARLTSMLHWKDDTAGLTNVELDAVFNGLFGTTEAWSDPAQTVVELVASEATACLAAPEGLNFPNKVVLSLEARLLADRIMKERLGKNLDPTKIEHNQTRQLFLQFQEKFGTSDPTYDALHRTVLITPEHLHLNAFMYEPLLDVADTDLRKLVTDLREISTSSSEEEE